MGERITGREIMMFIARFELWGAKLGNSLGGVTFLTANEDGNVIFTHSLLDDGSYEISEWVDPTGGDPDDGDYVVTKEGNIHDWENI